MVELAEWFRQLRENRCAVASWAGCTGTRERALGVRRHGRSRSDWLAVVGIAGAACRARRLGGAIVGAMAALGASFNGVAARASSL
jgi:hypothetical protein